MVARKVISSVIQRQVRHVKPVPAAAAGGLVATVYDQASDEIKLVVPPLLLHSPAPEVLAAYWMLMREPLMATGAVDRLPKEAVASAVSVANTCPYCVDMHSTGMYDLSTERDAEAIVSDRVDDVMDGRTREIAAWARQAHVPESAPAPFPEEHRPELVGVVVAFHYLSRMVNVFLPGYLLPPRLRPGARRRFKQGISRVLRPTLREPYPPGRSLPLLPNAPLPPEAAWAVGNPNVAAAVARSYAALEAAGHRTLSRAVRDLVLRRLDAWRGEDTGVRRTWCEDLVGELPAGDRAAGRLALLTAFASYQVDGKVVAEFRRYQPDDRALVEAAAWASFAAARQVGSAQVPSGRALVR